MMESSAPVKKTLCNLIAPSEPLGIANVHRSFYIFNSICWFHFHTRYFKAFNKLGDDETNTIHKYRNYNLLWVDYINLTFLRWLT